MNIVAKTSIYFPNLFGTSNSRTSTSSKLAIWYKTSSGGCTWLEHQRETVALLRPISSASHLLVRCFSAKMTLIRL